MRTQSETIRKTLPCPTPSSDVPPGCVWIRHGTEWDGMTRNDMRTNRSHSVVVAGLDTDTRANITHLGVEIEMCMCLMPLHTSDMESTCVQRKTSP